MGRSRYKIFEEYYPYFITSSIVSSIPLFSEPDIAELVLESILFLQTNRQMEINAYVIMENHLHMILKGSNAAEHIRNFKAFTAHHIIDYLNRSGRHHYLRLLKRAKRFHKTQSNYQVWEEGFHPKQISSPKMMEQKINYIHFNPVSRGYVDRPEHWRYSSATNYLGKKGIIPVQVFSG